MSSVFTHYCPLHTYDIGSDQCMRSSGHWYSRQLIFQWPSGLTYFVVDKVWVMLHTATTILFPGLTMHAYTILQISHNVLTAEKS